MKDFAGSRTTYYSLAREKLRGKHPRILSILMVLILISMAGFAAFLLSDIVSFGLNSNHQTFLAGLELQNSIDNILSMINWSEKSIEPAAIVNSVAQKGRFNNPLETNTSPGKGNTVRLVANNSGDENSSPSIAVNSSLNAKELNLSNSSRTASNQVSSDSFVRSTSGGSSSSKHANDQKAPLIKTNHGSSSGSPTSQPLKQVDTRVDQKYGNKTQVNSTQANAIQLNTTLANATQANVTQLNTTLANATQANVTQLNTTLANATQANATQANSTKVGSTQTINTSVNQLQIKEASATRSSVYGSSLSQLQADPTSAKATGISQSQNNVAGVDSSEQISALNAPEPDAGKTLEDPAMAQSGNEKTEGGSNTSEKENENTASESSPANPVTAFTVPALNSANEAALPTVADDRTDPAKEASAESRSMEIEFKTDSNTNPGSENSPEGENTDSGTVPNANVASRSATSESNPVAETKDKENSVTPVSKDSTSNSESPALGGGSASAKKTGATVASKSQRLQEIKYQKITNRNRAVENSKKKTIRSRG